MAIELAAARANLLQPAAIVERLTQRLTLLTTGTRDAPARQKSLRSCLAWSVDLLTEDERRLFSVMSVFAGGATLTSLEAVCANALPEIDPLATADSLVAKSLLRPVDGPAGARLWMLETIREYGAELLVLSRAEETVRRAHAHHYHDLLADDPNLLFWPPRNAEEIRVQSAELPNARAALRTLSASGETALYADLVVGVTWLARIQGYRDEQESFISSLLERDDLSVRRRIDLLFMRGSGLRGLADFAGTARAFSSALELLKNHPDSVQEAALRGLMANLPNHPGGERGRQKDLALAKEASLRSRDPEVIAMTVIHSVGLWADGAVAHLNEAVAALETVRELDNEILQVLALINLSEEALGCPDPTFVPRAEEWGREAFTIAARLGDPQKIALSLCNAAGASLLGGGDPGRAASDLRRSLEMERRIRQYRSGDRVAPPTGCRRSGSEEFKTLGIPLLRVGDSVRSARHRTVPGQPEDP